MATTDDDVPFTGSYNRILRQLALPFDPRDIEWRVQQGGMSGRGEPWVRVLAYVTGRAIHDRLDEVVGPANWRNEPPRPGPAGGVIQGISIRIAGEWVTKWDGAENTDIEGVKGGLSAALKRAAVLWGIGRYLYHLEEGYAEIVPKEQARQRKAHYARINPKRGEPFEVYWLPPALPLWAQPRGSGHPNRSLAAVLGDTEPQVAPEIPPTRREQAQRAQAAARAVPGVQRHADRVEAARQGGAILTMPAWATGDLEAPVAELVEVMRHESWQEDTRNMIATWLLTAQTREVVERRLDGAKKALAKTMQRDETDDPGGASAS